MKHMNMEHQTQKTQVKSKEIGFLTMIKPLEWLISILNIIKKLIWKMEFIQMMLKCQIIVKTSAKDLDMILLQVFHQVMVIMKEEIKTWEMVNLDILELM